MANNSLCPAVNILGIANYWPYFKFLAGKQNKRRGYPEEEGENFHPLVGGRDFL